MIRVVPARPEMAMMLTPQRVQVETGQVMTPVDALAAIRSGLAMAAVTEDRILAIGGVAELWPDRGMIWGVLAEGIGANMVHVHRSVARARAICPYRRVEAYVASVHEEGHRWIKMLGFAHEGRMRTFYEGHDYDLYSRVR